MNKNEILLPVGNTRRKIRETLGVSHVTVQNALKGRTNSELAKRIRKMALENGGAVSSS